MKAYYMTVQAWKDDCNQYNPATKTIVLTGYHTTQDGALSEFRNKFGTHPTYTQLSKRLKASIPDNILDSPNKVKVEFIDVVEDRK